jgi:transposase
MAPQQATSVLTCRWSKPLWLAGKCASEPQSITAVLRKHALGAVRIGLETGLLWTWLFHELRKQELPVICIDACHAKAALLLRVNKTDTNDAHGIAQIVRVGCYREVVVKSTENHTLRADAQRPRTSGCPERDAGELDPRPPQDVRPGGQAGEGWAV